MAKAIPHKFKEFTHGNREVYHKELFARQKELEDLINTKPAEETVYLCRELRCVDALIVLSVNTYGYDVYRLDVSA